MKRTAILLLAALALGACQAADDILDDSVFGLEVGTCFDDGDLDATEVSSVDDLSCDQPHDNEVYAVFDVDLSDYSAELIGQQADDGCLAAFEPYVGRDYFESELDFFTLTPTAGSWENGDREVICSLYRVDLGKMTGSMRDSGI